MSNNIDKSRGLEFKEFQDPKRIAMDSRRAHRQAKEIKKREEKEKRKAFEIWKENITWNPAIGLSDEEKDKYLELLYKYGAIRFSKYITPEQEILNE